ASTSFQDLPFVLSLSLGSMLVGEALRWPDLLLHINGGLWVMSLGLHLLSRDRNSVPEKVSRLLMTSALVLAAIGSMGFFRALN
ncbi:MAG TPA: hypothetical protein PLZ57_16420, partial [Pseudobdellovibrionaceae bacterium]|nr:hypothetical protein [Pseudobdellovibrionaceae bacterium]